MPRAGAALEAGDLDAFAAQVERSYELGKTLLGNQIPETMTLTEIAPALGARAASPFGAGFGGSVWALVRNEEADRFLTSWAEAYLERFPQHRELALFLRTSPGPGARELKEAS